MITGSCPGHGLVHLGSQWNSPQLGWERLWLLSLVLSSILELRFWRLGKIGLLLIFVCGRVSVEARALDIHGTLFGRDMALLGGVLVGGVWNGFLLGKLPG